MEIEFVMVEQESELTVKFKTQCEDEDISTDNIKIERDMDIKCQTNEILWTTIKEEPVDDVGIFKANINTEIVLPELKDEMSSNEEEGSFTEMKTEELMLKSENNNSGLGTKPGMKKIKVHGCNLCDYRTDRKHNLKWHIVAKHDKDSIKKYCCDLCEYRSHWKSSLKIHILKNHSKNFVKKYGCDLCSYRAHRRSDLTKHILIKHDKTTIKKYACYLCDYRTHTKCNMESHILSKHDKNSIKNLGCDICDYRTRFKSNLKTHVIRKHDKNSIKKYGCNICDYKTHLNSNLKRHMKSHEKKIYKKLQLPYMCL